MDGTSSIWIFFWDCLLKFVFPGEGHLKFFIDFLCPADLLIIVPLLKRLNMLGPAIFGNFKNLAENAEPAISAYFGMLKIPGNCRQCQKFPNPGYVCLPRLKIELIQCHLVRENLCKKFFRYFYPLFYRKIGLRLPHRNDAKIAKICFLWTFWLVIQLINHLLSDFKMWFIGWITGQNVKKLLFWHHSYEVTLNTHSASNKELSAIICGLI